MTPPANTQRYKNDRFPAEIISHGVRLYSRFTPSYRDVQELLLARVVAVSHEAIRQWCRKFGQDDAHWLRRRVGGRRGRENRGKRPVRLMRVSVSTS